MVAENTTKDLSYKLKQLEVCVIGPDAIFWVLCFTQTWVFNLQKYTT